MYTISVQTEQDHILAIYQSDLALVEMHFGG